MLLHRSDLNISAKFRQIFSHFSAKSCKCSSFSKKISEFSQILMIFFGSQKCRKWRWKRKWVRYNKSILEKIVYRNWKYICCRNFADILENVEMFNVPIFVNFLAKILEFWKNSDRTPIWKVRMVRSLADRTFQLSRRRLRRSDDTSPIPRWPAPRPPRRWPAPRPPR